MTKKAFGRGACSLGLSFNLCQEGGLVTDSSCSTCAGGDEFGELGKKFRVAGRKDPAADSGRKDFRGQNGGPGDQGGAGRGGGGEGRGYETGERHPQEGRSEDTLEKLSDLGLENSGTWW